MESAINNQQNSTTNITTMVSRLPSLQRGLNEHPNLTHGRPSEGVGRGQLRWNLFNSIK
jgi:hypothetical protein